MAYSGAGEVEHQSPYPLQLSIVKWDKDFPSIKLASDIDSSATINWNDGLGWTPIPFYGDDGTDTLSSLYINQLITISMRLYCNVGDDAVIKT